MRRTCWRRRPAPTASDAPPRTPASGSSAIPRPRTASSDSTWSVPGGTLRRTRCWAIGPPGAALAMAVDRATAAKAVFGPAAKAPPGPMSQLLWLWSDSIATLPFDRDAAARELDAAGWRVGQGRRPDPERPAARLRHSGAGHERRATAARDPAPGDVALGRRGGDGDVSGLPGLPGAVGSGSVRRLHRRLDRRAERAGPGRSVDPTGLGGAQLRALHQSGLRLVVRARAAGRRASPTRAAPTGQRSTC